MERIEYEKVDFSDPNAIVIPPMPSKEERVKEPSKADFDREMAAEDAKINERRGK